MASIHRQSGRPFWYCAFYDAAGRRRFRSTKTTSKAEARVICNAWASVAAKARKGSLSPERARDVIEDGVAQIMESSGHALPRATVRGYFRSWLKSKELEAADSSIVQYRSAVEDFLSHLGPRADEGLPSLGVDEIKVYRAKIAEHLSPTTANFKLQVLRTVLGAAVKERILTSNPALLVDRLASRDAGSRRAFTLPELRKVLAHADDTWRGMVLFGLYTGLRLSDCAGLTWHNVDLQSMELTLEVQKTGKVQILPLAGPLASYVQELPATDDPDAPLFPELAALAPGSLSGQFRRLLVQSGLASSDYVHHDGRRRAVSELSFHCLRHTATSLLKRAGVSEAVAKSIIGHKSTAISQHYTHIDSETKRAAMDRLPDVLA